MGVSKPSVPLDLKRRELGPALFDVPGEARVHPHSRQGDGVRELAGVQGIEPRCRPVELERHDRFILSRVVRVQRHGKVQPFQPRQPRDVLVRQGRAVREHPRRSDRALANGLKQRDQPLIQQRVAHLERRKGKRNPPLRHLIDQPRNQRIRHLLPLPLNVGIGAHRAGCVAERLRL
jgi:hypothetical protein